MMLRLDVLIFSTNFSLRLFLDCSYFSRIFQPSCSYKVCSYKKKTCNDEQASQNESSSDKLVNDNVDENVDENTSEVNKKCDDNNNMLLADK